MSGLHPWEIADALWLAEHHPDLAALGPEPGPSAGPDSAGPGSGDPVGDPAAGRDATGAAPDAADQQDQQGRQDAGERPPGEPPPPTADSANDPADSVDPVDPVDSAEDTGDDPEGYPAGDPAPRRAPAGAGAVPVPPSAVRAGRGSRRGPVAGRAAARLDTASLGRALRPLRRPVDTARVREVDEEATAERLAEDPGLPPVTRPGPEPRWDAVLLVDVAPQMAVWSGTAQRLADLLRRYGNFRDFQLRFLDTRAEDPENVVVRGPADGAGPQSPRRLVDLSGRRIVFVLTDGRAAAWRSGAAQSLIAMWGRHQPAVVLQALPQRLWHRTALDPQRVRLHASGPWRAGTAWDYAEPLASAPLVPQGARRRTPVPVLEVAGDWLAPWTRFLAGEGPRWTEVPALLLPRGPWRRRADTPERDRPARSAGERVANFRVWASPDAFRLATRLATAPLDLRVMTSVQRRTLPRTGPTQLAEFLMSDLVEPLPDNGGDAFSFYPGVREELLASSTRQATEIASRSTAELLAPHSGAARDLLAYLDGGPLPGEPEVTGENLRLREIERSVLESLSGAHLRRARLIGQLIRAHGVSDQNMDGSARGESSSVTRKESSAIVNESGVPDVPRPAQRFGPGEAGTPPGGTKVATAPPVTTPASGVELSRPSPASSPMRPSVWGNMPPRNLVFTGRQDLLDRLERELRDGPTAVLPHALHGLGGVGKSQLAQEYVYRQAGQYDIVWWIPAERPTQISQALVELAQRLHLPVSSEAITAVPAVLEALRTGNPYGKWLLVFDNAESPEAVQDFFPSSPEGGPVGSIIITSRNPQWNTLARPLEVDVFERAESIQLLQRRNPDLSDGEADQLADVLGDLPLAVEQASAWRAETGMPAAEYLRLFEEKRAELMTVSPPTHYEQTVATAWNVSLDHMASKNPAALQLLQICAYFASEPIARSLFSGAPVEPIAPDLDRALTDPLRLGRAIREINRYSLAKIDHRNNSIQMHRLVQAVLVARMTEEQRERMRRGAHLLLAANAPRDPRDPEHWARFGDLYPHVVVSGAIESDSRNVRQMVIQVAQYLYFWGDHESAREFGQRTYERWEEKFGDADQQTLLLCRDLWYVLWRMGRYGEAAELSAKMLTVVQGLGEDAEEELLSTMGAVAIDRRSQGDFLGALSMAEDVRRRAVSAYGEDDPLTLDHTHNLAVALRSCGRYHDALALDEETWRRNVLLYGEEAYDSLLSEMGLALDRREAGDYALGVRMFEEIVDKYRNVFGEMNPHTLRATARLAVSRRKAGDHQGAYELSLQARKALTDRYSERSPDSLVASLNLSVDMRQMGHLDEALAMGERTRDLYAEVFGSSHPDTVAADIDLAITLRLVNQVDAARSLNESALGRAREALGQTHPTVLVCATNLASDLFAQGDAAGALEMDEHTLEAVKGTLGEEHPTALALMGNIAVDLRALRRNEEAEAIHATALDGLRSKLGPAHPACADTAAWRRANCDVDPMP